MINTELNKLPLDKLRTLYKEFLIDKGKGHSTIQTYMSDTFYLWNNVSKEFFWKIVISDDFENEAKSALFDALAKHSSGQVDDLLNGYVAVLRMFRNFVVEYDGEIDSISDEEALKNFLLDIDCLDQLDEWTGKFNLFDILKITRAEIRHSNLLAWLLTPYENHGLNDSILKGFVKFAITALESKKDELFDTLLMDFGSFSILREWHNIDVLAISDKEKHIVCIENKIDTGEHDNQLDRYQKIL